jgi:hypothetical protein
MQHLKWGNALEFLQSTEEVTRSIAGPPDRLRVFALRGASLLEWSGLPLALALVAAALIARRPKKFWGALVCAALGLGTVAAQIAWGRPYALHTVGERVYGCFPARLTYPAELALVPLASVAVGLALQAARTPIARVALVAGLLALGSTQLAWGLSREPEVGDEASAELGLRLRRGELDRAVGGGRIAIERVPYRPPFGWASAGVAWSRLERVVWMTRRPEGWELVMPPRVDTARWRIGPQALASWLDAHGVSAVWAISPEVIAALRELWPRAHETHIREGVLFTRHADGLTGEPPAHAAQSAPRR